MDQMGNTGMAVIIIGYCLPRDTASNYNYEEGRPWNYSSSQPPLILP